VLAGEGEAGVFRKKAVAGMDRVCAGAPGGLDDCRDVQIRLLHRSRADIHGFVGHLHMQRIGVGIAVNSDCAVAQGLGGTLDAAGDFTAVGDQDFSESGHGFFPGGLRCM